MLSILSKLLSYDNSKLCFLLQTFVFAAKNACHLKVEKIPSEVGYFKKLTIL